MTRRLVWFVLIIGLISLGIVAANFLIKNFTGLGPVPTRSAFAGRLPSLPDGSFEFFYVTNRVNTEEAFLGRGNQLAKEITNGTYNVQISPYLPVLPFVWFDQYKLKWLGKNEMPKDEFREKIRHAVQASPKKSVLVIVWGFRDWFESAALKTAYTGFLLDINTPVLLFDWPGNQGEGARGYRASQVVATQSAPDLGKVLADLIHNAGAENVWLMGSSLGCQTICDAFVWLYSQPDIFKDKPKIAQVVLAAPDVSANAFDEKFSERIQALSNHLTAYVSSNDTALLMSHWLNRGRRLGRTAEITVPPTSRIGEYEFEEALELLELQAKGARQISVVDASPINRLRNLHHFFTDSPEFFDDLYQRFLQPDDIVSRRLHHVRDNRLGASYWIIWNN